MSNLPEHNYPEFFRMAELLRGHGFEVVNPAELHPADPSVPWSAYLKADIPHLLTCDGIVLLRGWEISKGARLEKFIAQELEFEIVQWNELESWLAK